jgi:hypothetical protein
METMTQVCAVGSPVAAFPVTDGSSLTDLYIERGQRPPPAIECVLLEVLAMAAAELWRRGEADAARVTLKGGRCTVWKFLRERFGIVTGAREYGHRSNWTPDRADLQEFLGALRVTALPPSHLLI